MRFSRRPFALTLVLMMLTIGTAWLPCQAEASVGAENNGLKEQTPFIIEGNVDMVGKAMANGWPGDGTSARPYLINDLIFRCDANVSPIDIRNTTLCFQISNCVMIATGQEAVSIIYRSAGVSLTNVANGSLSHVTITGFSLGVDVQSSRNIRIENCSVSDSLAVEIYALYSHRLVIENNTVCGANGSGIQVVSSERATIQCNNASFNDYCGINLGSNNYEFLVRWNLASRNGHYGSTSVGSALHLGGNDIHAYGNVLVSAGGRSPPAGTDNVNGIYWNSSDGYGNYYGSNYDPAVGKYASFLGEPLCSQTDNDKNGISDKAYSIRYFGGYSGGSSVDAYPLISPSSPPRDLRAAVAGDIVTLSWEPPLFTTFPSDDYVVVRDDGRSKEMMNVTGRQLTDSIVGLDDWSSISYYVVWSSRHITSVPSASVSVQHPDKPSLTIVSNLDTSEVTLYNLTALVYSSLDPRSVTVEWRGYDSNSDSMSYIIRLDDGEWLDNDNYQGRTFTNLSEGAHTITIRATDSDGNEVEASRTFEVYKYVEMSLACRPYKGDDLTQLRLDGRAWDAVTGIGMADLPIGVAYSVDRGTSWAFGSATTGPDGRFEFAIGLETEVIHGLMFTAEIRDLNNEVHYFIEEGSYAAVIPQGQNHLFMAYSERTISDLSFSSRLMKFNVSAGSGELGLTTILIPKAASVKSADITVTLDGARYDREVSEDGDYWVLSIDHNASSHKVTVEIKSSGLDLIPPGDLPLFAAGAVGITIMAGITVLAWRSKRSGGRP